jgi:hypothetical protein
MSERRLILEYAGKKGAFTLSLRHHKETYQISGPKARVSFHPADAASVLRENPGMFKVIGVDTSAEAKPNTSGVAIEAGAAKPDKEWVGQFDVTKMPVEVLGFAGQLLFTGTVGELMDAYRKAYYLVAKLAEGLPETIEAKPLPAAADMLEEQQEPLPGDYKRDDSLTGDGIEGDEEGETAKEVTEAGAVEGNELPAAASPAADIGPGPHGGIPNTPKTHGELMGMKKAELRDYAKYRFGITFADEDERFSMIKRIRELEVERTGQTGAVEAAAATEGTV